MKILNPTESSDTVLIRDCLQWHLRMFPLICTEENEIAFKEIKYVLLVPAATSLLLDVIPRGKHFCLIKPAFLGFSVGKIFENTAKYKIFSDIWSRNVD